MATSTKSRPGPAKNGHGDAYEGDGKNRPVHEERIGRICAAVWEHSDGNGKLWHNVTFSRIYKDQANQWARSDSFGKNDLPLLQKVADRVHDWLYSNNNGDE
jgi:hypothetical protein